jgi:hypothetical protein
MSKKKYYFPNRSNSTTLNPSNSRGLDFNYLEIGVIENVNYGEFATIRRLL